MNCFACQFRTIRNTLLIIPLLTFSALYAKAQNSYELNKDWHCINVSKVKEQGSAISNPSYQLSGWLSATVPGTVLTTQLHNKLIPDPFFGMNNEKIPDIYETGPNYYTYWFVNDFEEKVSTANEQVWLHFRGVNYGCDVFLNGQKLNKKTHLGMFLPQTYNITALLSKSGKNRLAVIVYPVDPVGNPNGGQGGDGTIARNVAHQYVAGWDWIQPIRDRNTGIWDKVIIEKTNLINLKNPHVITVVPGKRLPGKPQEPALIKASAEIENPTGKAVKGTLQYIIEGNTVKQEVTIPANSTREFKLPDYTLKNPKLWWPYGYGSQDLYNLQFQFTDNTTILDKEDVTTGIREIQTTWNSHTGSMQVSVNGQKVFIKGGNWIISDAMLRFTAERYDAEVRFHRDMNLNLIRIWGGALPERPEFYQACNKYGLLVFQDFWMSGDCNGRWLDPMKKEDQWTRRQYPDDHSLFLQSVVEQVKLMRNHPSLAFYCGGNEITPPEDILLAMQDSILPALDGTRYFFTYSNTDSMSYNFLGGNGDGPYGIQPINTFWETRTFPFNSEIGSVGTGDYESLERFIPKENLVVPDYANRKVDSVWAYHKDIGYGSYIDAYGKPKDVKDFGLKAQLVNYDQYRALIEGHSAHMWDWYTGVIIWKTQNPWTSLRGQMYDYYLDPNACLYGLQNAGEPLHVMCNPVDGMVTVVNNSFSYVHDVMLEVKAIDMNGKDSLITQVFIEVSPTSVQKYLSVKPVMDQLRKEHGIFLSLRLLKAEKQVLSENLYWLPDASGNYSGLQKMAGAKITTTAKKTGDGKVEVKINNPADGPLAFFTRVSLVDAQNKKRILPVFYSQNYISVAPGQEKTIVIDNVPPDKMKQVQVSVAGWNVQEQFVNVAE